MKEKETGFLDADGSLHSGHHRGHRWVSVVCEPNRSALNPWYAD